MRDSWVPDCDRATSGQPLRGPGPVHPWRTNPPGRLKSIKRKNSVGKRSEDKDRPTRTKDAWHLSRKVPGIFFQQDRRRRRCRRVKRPLPIARRPSVPGSGTVDGSNCRTANVSGPDSVAPSEIVCPSKTNDTWVDAKLGTPIT